MKLRSSNFGSSVTGFTPGVKNFPWRIVTWPFKKLKTSFNISGIGEATLIKFGKWIDYGTSHPMSKNFLSKGRGLGHITPF